MAQMVLILGESGTGKSTSMRNCDPAEIAVVNPVGKQLPFKNKFVTLDNVTDSKKVCKWMKEQANTGKKLLVIDDFQYILAVPYMNRIKESGWDKYNDFGANYFEIIEVCKELPEDVVVAYLSHIETLDNGLTTIKLIGKLLREKITIEGLFTTVLRTNVTDGQYYFITQNSGKDTVKSPMGMFPAYAIDNDLQYVADKIRSYYEVGDYKSEEEMQAADTAVASDLEKPDAKGRRARGATKRTREEVEAKNNEKIAEYMEKVDEGIADVLGDTDAEGIPLEQAPTPPPAPDLEPLPPKERKKRSIEPKGEVQEDSYWHTADDNYIKVHAGDAAPDGAEQITKEQFDEGVKALAQATTTTRRRRTR